MLEDIEPVRILIGQVESFVRSLIAVFPNIIAALFVLILTMLVAMLAGWSLSRAFRRTKMRESLQSAIQSLVRTAIWVGGLVICATVLFPNLTPTKALAGLGLGSIAVGFAFKDIFENFLAGILILVREPMRIGDDIECADVSGKVERITIRDSHIRKRSGELVLVPNAYLFGNPIRILTDQPLRRIDLVVGVAYGEDVDAARDVILRAVNGLESVDASQSVEVFAREFNASSIDFVVRWWTGSTPIEEHRSRDIVVSAIKTALDEAGIEIPFPYRTLTFKEPLHMQQHDG
ncbi:mechanosensitive ion channel family protein [Amaricoccus macauensis]|uniref:mechanosensitive ion channel family protein n=1 Tax=Amaricoccus macauensis TaxID=57001 RepID=UPI003C7B6BE3